MVIRLQAKIGKNLVNWCLQKKLDGHLAYFASTFGEWNFFSEIRNYRLFYLVPWETVQNFWKKTIITKKPLDKPSDSYFMGSSCKASA